VVFEGGTGAVLMLRPLAMHRLFSNLVDNAVMYAHARAGGAQRRHTAMVADDGPGLAEEQLEAVFDPFVRVETSRSRETGGAGWA
jgi:signal transduction histidine kinase